MSADKNDFYTPEQIEALKQSLKSNNKSISEVSGVKRIPPPAMQEAQQANSRMCFPKQHRNEESIPYSLNRSLISEEEKQHAEMELAYIRAAIAVCQSTELIAVEIKVAGLPSIGVSQNFHVIENLRYEEEQIEKYLRGEPNTYE